jgi:hypothetical protein
VIIHTDSGERNGVNTFLAAEDAFRRMSQQAKELHDVELLDVSTPAILRRHSMRGGVCLVGSKTYKMTEDQVKNWRASYSALPDFEFVGLDIEPGLNVDVVADLCDPDFIGSRPELQARFGLVVCGALLEHVKDPFLAARNVASLIKPGGHLYYLGPWVWGYHAYPDDYWRFSFSALKLLFPQLQWQEWWYSSTTKGIGVKVRDPSKERALFQLMMPASEQPKTLAELVTDRAMPYLNVGAIARRP